MSKVMEVLSQIVLGIFFLVIVFALGFGFTQMSEEDKDQIIWMQMMSNQ